MSKRQNMDMAKYRKTKYRIGMVTNAVYQVAKYLIQIIQVAKYLIQITQVAKC